MTTPFRLDVSDDTLADLHARLDRARIPTTTVRDCGWDYGMEPGFHAALIDYWRHHTTGARQRPS